jgi:catechol-2,3-dioxygenase
MSFAIQHVHVKTKDPKQTMQFYIDNLGATSWPKSRAAAIG